MREKIKPFDALRVSPSFEYKIHNWAKKSKKMQENVKKRQKASNVGALST